jgi:hypothetical protein
MMRAAPVAFGRGTQGYQNTRRACMALVLIISLASRQTKTPASSHADELQHATSNSTLQDCGQSGNSNGTLAWFTDSRDDASNSGRAAVQGTSRCVKQQSSIALAPGD